MKKLQRFSALMCVLLVIIWLIPVCQGQEEDRFRVEEAGLSLSLAGWDGYVYTRQLQGEGAELKNARPTDPEILREMEESDTYLLVRPAQESGEDWEIKLLCAENKGAEHDLMTPEELMGFVYQLDTSGLMELGFEWIERGLLVHPQTQLLRVEAAMAGWIDCVYEVGYGEKRVTLGISYDVEKAGEEIRQRAEQTALSMRFDGLTDWTFTPEHGTSGTRLTIPAGWTWLEETPVPESDSTQMIFGNYSRPETVFSFLTESVYEDWLLTEDWLREMGENECVGEYTTSVRQYGPWEYHCLKGNLPMEEDVAPVTLAFRQEDGVLYVYSLMSTQMSESMADFEQILSDAEYSGQSGPAAEAGPNTGTLIAIGAAVAVLGGTAILFCRRKIGKSE